MSTWRSLPDRFRQLRWKLTLSYTGVTVGALLTVELILLSAVSILLVVLVNGGFLPTQLIELASVHYAPALRPYLAQSPPDQAGIANWLERVGAATSTIIPLTFEATDEILVVGSDERLLGVRPPDLLGSNRIGQPLDFGAIPGLADPVQAALAGETDPKELYTIVRADNRVIMAVPIRDADNEQVLGALVGIGQGPTMTTLLGDLVPILGISLLFFTIVAGLVGTGFGFLAARGLVQRFDTLAEATLAWSQGDFTVFVDDPSGDELGQLSHRLNRMAEQLEHLLETRRELAVLEERNRLARDLHDSVKQQAFAAAGQLDAVQTLLERDPKAAAGHVAEAVHLVDELRRELAGILRELRPATLKGEGLVAGLRDYSSGWSRRTGITAQVHAQGERSLSLEVEQTLFRIVQEALSNVARHSQANRVEILLAYRPNGIALTVDDDGQGFVVDDKHKGLGLRSIHERVGSLGGILTVESAPGKGTRLSCTVQVDSSGEAGGEESLG
jgi:NarL family two-component system sensor histidine kinase LiaS